jgi:hypothetical protein
MQRIALRFLYNMCRRASQSKRLLSLRRFTFAAMKTRFIILLLTICFPLFAGAESTLVKRVQFASVEKAKQLLATEDDFTKSWSRFDIDSRIGKQNGKKEELVKYITTQVKEWTAGETAKVSAMFGRIDSVTSTNGYKLAWPADIYFIKTTGKEEGGADGYTRTNYVVLSEQVLSQPDSMLCYMVAHELFHVLSRNDNAFRKSMYDIIGFKLMSPVAYPPSLADRRITNPDATQTDSYITLDSKGKGSSYMMVLYSDKEYDGGDFFKYLQVALLQVDVAKGKAVTSDNGPVLLKLDDVPEYFEKIGSNTQYIIHPDEIMADNFSFLINDKKDLPSQWIIDKMRTALK